MQAVHSAAMRESPCCTLRVCEVILNLLELLVDIGVLKPPAPQETTPTKDQAPGPSTSATAPVPSTSAAPCGAPDQDSQSSDPGSAKGSDGKKGPDRFGNAHCLMLNTVLRCVRSRLRPRGGG